MAKDLPSHARAVIVGGGIVGCSIAYHLAKLGWSEVVLLEQGQLSCGTTWHAAGLIGQLRATHNQTALAKYTRDLYLRLEEETGQATGYRTTGSISVAHTPAREEELRRQAAMAATFGIECTRMTLEEAKERLPILRTDDLVAAYWIETDGMTNPTDTTQALAKGARAGGATILEGVKATRILTSDGRVAGVETPEGNIASEVVVAAAGMWTRELAASVDVTVPLHAAEHYYIVTRPIDGVVRNQPVLRDMDGYIYVKEEVGGLVVGGFEPDAKPWGMDGIPDHFEFQTLDEDWDQFELFMKTGIERLPVLETAEVRQLLVGPESFTPDNRYILGEAPELGGFFVAAGFNSIGIQSAGGAGKALAEWITDGAPTMDLAELDIRRFHRFQRNPKYLEDRTRESLGLLYAMHWPFHQPSSARGARRGPLHDRLAEAGACFSVACGWERPGWFAEPGETAEYTYAWERTPWFANWAAEHKAAREAVALFDMTSFAKFRLEGPDAAPVLERVCAADTYVAPGRMVYTQWLNEKGGIEADLTVTRLSEDAYLIVTGAATAERDFAWLKGHIGGAQAVLTDVTSGLSALGVMGPNSRDLLSQLTGANLSNEAFPLRTVQELEIGYAPVLATRISYIGELGWELYVASEFTPHLFERIMGEADAYGLKLAGYHAMDSLRQEKGYRHWGHDIGIEDTPLEAGLGFTLDRENDYIGKPAIEAQRGQALAKRLVQFKLDDDQDPGRMVYHDEPIYRDGERVGALTSASWGHTLGAAVGMGYVHADDGVTREWLEAGTFEIDVAGERMPAMAQLEAFYDPKGERMKG